jgi:oxaloacetate decarboxylase gamma subunit
MGQSDLLAEAINLTFFGMGFVFLFLTLLVFVTKLMSTFVRYIYKNKQVDSQNGGPSSNSGLNDELDEETKFVIEKAIKMHRSS